jgi:hypothetical protein
LNERFAVAHDPAQLANLHRGYEAGADQPASNRLRDPGRVRDVGLSAWDVGLSAWDVAQVLRIEQQTLELRFEQGVDRLPMHAGRLHSNDGDFIAREPVIELERVARRRRPSSSRSSAESTSSSPFSSITRTQAATDALWTSSPTHRRITASKPHRRKKRQKVVRRSLIMKSLKFVLTTTVRCARGSRVLRRRRATPQTFSSALVSPFRAMRYSRRE